MIKQILHRGFSAILAVLVLLSTVSFTIEKHFCGDVLVDVSVFVEAEKCAMEAEEMELAKITKKSCCKDEINIVEGQDELIISFEDLDFEHQQIISSFVYSYIALFESLPKQIIPHKDYSPPNLVLDIQLLNDTFLI